MVKVKILGISGSPRHGNTDILVKEALKAAEGLHEVDVEFISLADVKIDGGCKADYACWRKPEEAKEEITEERVEEEREETPEEKEKVEEKRERAPEKKKEEMKETRRCDLSGGSRNGSLRRRKVICLANTV